MELTLKQAQAAVEAAHQKSLDLGLKMNIAVVDAGANLLAFARMEGAWLGSIDIAIKKAKTARYFDMATADLGKMAQPGEPLYGIEHSNHGLISFGGGLPIEDQDGNIIGAIGSSGSTVDNDVKVAKACKKAVENK